MCSFSAHMGLIEILAQQVANEPTGRGALDSQGVEACLQWQRDLDQYANHLHGDLLRTARTQYGYTMVMYPYDVVIYAMQ